MKVVVALLAASVAAQQHMHHGHQHVHEKRQGSPAYDVVSVPGPTVVVYELNGQPISEADVQEGIRNGTLVWAPNGQISSLASTSVPATSAPAVSSPAATSAPESSSSYVPPPSSSSSASSIEVAANYVHPSKPHGPPSGGDSGSPDSYDSGSANGVDEEFPDGQIDCSTFPSDYGAISVPWMGLGGWTGVQSPGSSLGGFSNIMTVTYGGGCGEGDYCSYACPAGYQKSQWPETQGATGQSVGGLLCKDGKLHLTNPGMSKNLCMTGTQIVTVLVENELSSNVAVCRTDYPGTEGETVPLNVQPGQTSNVTCPDADNYYNWEGGSTSAQYYVNPAGVSVSDACQWGSSDKPWGNYAPMNLGVGYSAGAAWISLFQNYPTTTEYLDYTVEITGDSLSGSCKYQNQQFCSSTGCNSREGCTVSAASGVVKIVFS